MCIIAATAILVFHPGFCFNYRVLNKDYKSEKKLSGNSSDELGMQSPMAV